MWEARVLSLGGEEPLEKEMASHSSILGWRIPWTEEPGRPQSMESQRVRHNWALNLGPRQKWVRFSRVCIKHLLCTQLSLCIRVIKSDKRFKDGWSHYQSRGFHPQCSVTKCRCSGSDRLSWCIRKKHLAKWPNTPFMLQTFFFLFAMSDLFFLTLYQLMMLEISR